MDADTAVLADREIELAGSAYRGGGSCPGRRLGTSSNGVEPAQELGDGANLSDALVQCGLLVAAYELADEDLLALRLPELMAERGHEEEAAQLRRFGLNPDGSIAQA